MNENAAVDFENGYNRLILSCLALSLGEVRAEFVAYFVQCVAELSEKPRGFATVNGYPIFADPNNGIILAAVCGASGVAVRLPAYATGKIIAEGAKDTLIYEGGEKRLIVPYSGDSDAWVITDGTQNLANVRWGLSSIRSLLATQNAMQVSRKAAANAINLDRPENTTVQAYLKALNAMPGSPSPDVLSFVFGTLPERAKIKKVDKTVENVSTMVHPDTGIIFAFCKNEYLYVRLPETARVELLQAKTSTGNTAAFAIPEIDVDWMGFAAFSIQDKSPGVLAAAHQYAGTK
ncbi:MAG: hypothetical protein H0X30_06680 [Anaerolineae bacterium]|nr:hypothetical protein [Anaerolineae bacterium]